MFRIFRQVRKEQLGSKRFRKYLAYALGEIALVVVGILIALQFNNADMDRQDRVRERQYMASLVSDLEMDIENIEQAVEGNRIQIEGMDDLLGLMALGPGDDVHQRRMLVSSIKHTYWYLEADMSEGAMSQLKYSGGFEYIVNPEVVRAIVRYDQARETSRDVQLEIKRYFHAMESRQKTLFNLSLTKKAYEMIEADPLNNMFMPLETYDRLVREGNYLLTDDPAVLNAHYGDVLFYRTTLNNYNLIIMEQRNIATSLIDLIRAEFGSDI